MMNADSASEGAGGLTTVASPADRRPSVEVPFLDLRATHAPLRAAILADVADLLDTCAFANGPAIVDFEQSFAAYCRAAHAVGVASGLDALRLALIAADIRPGDEVVVPANTFNATLEAVSQAGGVPVPVDVSLQDYNLDVRAVADAIGPRTRFLMPVHLYGQMADMRGLGALAIARDLLVVEDACQAHGAMRDGLRPGAESQAAAFSFYPGKNLGAIGDAGALITPDAVLAERVRALREHGQSRKYHHDEVGYTARLDTLQAQVLSRKLRLLDGWNAERRAGAAFYVRGLTGVGDLVMPPVAAASHPSWHLFVIRTEDPHALADFLSERGVATGRHYPVPVHLTGAYSHLGHRAGAFPVAERLAGEVLSLPLFPGIGERRLAAVVDSVTAYFARRSVRF